MTLTEAPFFTIDRGTATTAAALIGRAGGRWRLLAAGAAPAAIEPDVLLADLVGRVGAADPALLAGAGSCEDWRRLESVTATPPAIALAATSERTLAPLELAFADAGWRVAVRITPDRGDAIGSTEALLDPDLRAVAIGAAPGDQGALSDLAALISAAVGRRPDVRVLLTGSAAVAATWFPPEMVVQLPGPGGSAATLPECAERLATEAWSRAGGPAGGGSTPQPDARGRIDFRRSVTSLSAVLDLRLDGIDAGAAAASRVLAGPGGAERWMIRADAALVPVSAGRGGVEEERALDAVVSWSPLRDDGQTQRDRIRNLRLAPWRDVAGDGARLRLAAARAALSRLDDAWLARFAPAADPWSVPAAGGGSADGNAAGPGAQPGTPGVAPADMLVVSGGAFAVAPPPAVALALIDAIRRPGAIALVLDHARTLAPLGSLDDESDRRRLLADLADDILLPLGGAILAGGLRQGRKAHLRVEAEGAVSETELLAGTVQVVDLPPGLLASVEIVAPDELWFGVRARHVRFEVAGGLGGLLVDTRGIPLRLPHHPERRREALEAWQRPLWTTVDGS